MKNRFKVLELEDQKYYFDRVIFRTFILFFLTMFLILLSVYGFKNHFYYSCPSNALGGVCQNIFWENCSKNNFYSCAVDISVLPSEYKSLSSREFINAGESFGKKPTRFLDLFTVSFVISFVFVFVFNHLLYNKGFNFKKVFQEVDKK